MTILQFTTNIEKKNIILQQAKLGKTKTWENNKKQMNFEFIPDTLNPPPTQLTKQQVDQAIIDEFITRNNIVIL